MKKISLVFAAITIAVAVNAQNHKTTFQLGVNAGAPVTSGYKFAYGADVQVNIGLSTNGAFTISGGYENVSTKAFTVGNVTFPESNFGFMPLLGGFKYNFPSSKLYGHAQVGYGIGTSSNSKGFFVYAPSLGYNISPNFDASVKYMGLSSGGSDLGNVLLRLAYTFGK